MIPARGPQTMFYHYHRMALLCLQSFGRLRLALQSHNFWIRDTNHAKQILFRCHYFFNRCLARVTCWQCVFFRNPAVLWLRCLGLDTKVVITHHFFVGPTTAKPKPARPRATRKQAAILRACHECAFFHAQHSQSLSYSQAYARNWSPTWVGKMHAL